MVGVLEVTAFLTVEMFGQAAEGRYEASRGEKHVQCLQRPHNNRVNAPGRPVTPLAVASVAPVRPARYAGVRQMS